VPSHLGFAALSYAAYAEIPADGRRWEFLDGEVYVTPAPSPAHQFAAQRLLRLFEDNLRLFGSDLIAFIAPIDVVLSDSEIVQPDVVIARLSQVSERGIEGAPPLLVEVVSPTRPHLDRDIKARRYAAHRVERYWLVDPVARQLDCFRLTDGVYIATASGAVDAVVELADVAGLRIELSRLWLPPSMVR
jgi:Uma2 family endonuclease